MSEIKVALSEAWREIARLQEELKRKDLALREARRAWRRAENRARLLSLELEARKEAAPGLEN